MNQFPSGLVVILKSKGHGFKLRSGRAVPDNYMIVLRNGMSMGEGPPTMAEKDVLDFKLRQQTSHCVYMYNHVIPHSA